jgi:tRNA nucleotidyltransferase (CCA-adding enzyme)
MTPSILSLPGAREPFPIGAALQRLGDTLVAAGARPVLVGGCVRDHLLGIASKDIDLEVFGLPLADVERVCGEVGSVHAVGRSFGVLKVRVLAGDEDETFDVALPRRESKVGQGHRGFVVDTDPTMSFADAAARRDFTLNAIGWDLERAALLDEHGGVADLSAGVLRHVSDAFDEDPLRVLRACQFAARFGLTIAPETIARCRHLQEELFTLPKERLWEEMKKLLVRAPWPSIGLCALDATGALALFPELAALQGCQQEAEWHPEGDVWVHNLMVVDEAARLCRAQSLDDEETLRITLGALCHDLGKPATTIFERDRWRSPGHEAAGEAPTRAFLERIGAPNAIVDDVVPLVRDHLKPFQLYAERDKVSDGALRRLALRVPLERLARVATADHFGRTTADALAREDPASPWLLEQADRLRLADAAPTPLLLGRHLMDLGVKPGPHMGPLLKEAFDAQLEGEFEDIDGGLAWLRARLERGA